MTEIRGALLTGSVNYDDAETTFRTVAEILGGHVRRIPDGEVGKRFHWIMFQPDVLGAADGIERVGEQPIPFGAGLDARPLRLAEGVDVASIELPPLGYASAAAASYALFARLREEGVIPAGLRFQVSLPTPVAVISSFFRGEERAAFEPVYADALLEELEQILETVPPEELAIQWDVASEMGILEGASGYGALMDHWWTGDVLDGIVARLAALVDAVPAGVEVGMHLCYGDAGEKHFVEPTDTANLVRVANAVIAAAGRELSWLHLPVPIGRDDEAYAAPLAELTEVRELYLGLVHREDGAEGARRRLAAALPALRQDVGVATECGIGRAPAGTTEDILRTHAEVAAPR